MCVCGYDRVPRERRGRLKVEKRAPCGCSGYRNNRRLRTGHNDDYLTD